MLIWLVDLSEHVKFFNLFRYITFRTGGALFTSALIVFLFDRESLHLFAFARARGSRSVPMDRRRISRKPARRRWAG